MAAAQAEITGRPGAIVATLGPGGCSAMNGTAHAFLDRVPLIVITDCEGSPQPEGLHQALAQTQIFAPVTKLSRRLRADEFPDIAGAIAQLPPGPVHLDVPGDFTSAIVDAPAISSVAETHSVADCTVVPRSRRPVFLVGLGARNESAARVIRELCEQRGVAALVTYKAKGVVPDDHPWFAGVSPTEHLSGKS